MCQLTKENIIGYPVASDPIDQFIAAIRYWIDTGNRPRYFVCANPHSLVLAADDPLFKAALRSADLSTPDGIGIVLASKILSGAIRERVTGSDVFEALSRELNNHPGRIYTYFFLGSTKETLSAIKQKLAVDFPYIEFAGAYSPPYKDNFNDRDNRKMVEAVNQASPDVLWVGMTAPKQEKWIFQHKDQLNVKFIGAVGAVFDFYCGNVKRSHPYFQRMGLEWLPRLIRDPRRLYDRMFVSAPKFMAEVIRQRLKRLSA